ncbi:MAG: protein-disulfide reductase DsbD [Burkholderiaceae bacterium]|nr:protein-disulfide reductase DsbD [Burkholderiaceae bacterium]
MSSTASPHLLVRRPLAASGRLAGSLLGLLASLLLWFATPALAADDFLPPEQAFRVSARMLAADRAEVSVLITPGYYLYREPLRFGAQGAVLGVPEVPPGKVKFDENFQKNVETYRDALRVGLPVSAAAGPFSLSVVVQGCADAGLCYPPMTTELRLDPAVLGGTPAAPAPAAAGAAASPWSLDALLGGAAVDRVLSGGRMWQVVLAFFGMGLLLSFTPCVLPMLPILSSLIVGTQRRPSRLRGLLLAAAYALGMALVYTALGVAAGLAGEGFGAALQTPWAIAGFSGLLVLLSLSMFDVYQLRLPHRWTTHLSLHSNRLPAGQMAGVFVMGGVSALIVSPCVTAPLAGALLFISQSGDVVQGGAALFSMAGGMSVPLLLLGASAGRWLPKAGLWMHGVKRLFGLLMLAVALWLAQPVLPIAAVMALWGLLLLLAGYLLRPFGVHGHHRHALRSGLQRTLGMLALALGLMQIVGAASGGRDPLRPLAHLGANAAAPGKLPRFQRIDDLPGLDAALLAAGGRPVMLDFYADWCVSCKEMERFTFSDPAIAARLGRAVLLKADVTANSEAHRALLRRFKLFGPPGTLFFDGTGQEIAAARVVGFQNAERFGRSLDRAGL